LLLKCFPWLLGSDFANAAAISRLFMEMHSFGGGQAQTHSLLPWAYCLAMALVQVGKAPKICRSKKYEEPTPLNVLKRDEKW